MHLNDVLVEVEVNYSTVSVDAEKSEKPPPLFLIDVSHSTNNMDEMSLI